MYGFYVKRSHIFCSFDGRYYDVGQKMVEDFLLFLSIDGGDSVGKRKLREEILVVRRFQ